MVLLDHELKHVATENTNKFSTDDSFVVSVFTSEKNSSLPFSLKEKG
jgi:hypothetical protein